MSRILEEPQFTGLTSIAIKVDGKDLDPKIDVSAIYVQQSVNRIDSASFTLRIALEEIPGLDLSIGRSVDIWVGWEKASEHVFSGDIRSFDRQMNDSGVLYRILCQNKSHRLLGAPATSVYFDQTDQEVMTAICTEAGLEIACDNTETVHPQLIRRPSSDYDFLLQRAAANGMLIYQEENKVQIRRPNISGSPQWSALAGRNVFSVQLHTGEGDPSKSEHFRALTLQTGSIRLFGSTAVKINTLFGLQGFGDGNEEQLFVSGLQHELTSGGWFTTLFIGLSPDLFAASEAKNLPHVLSGVLHTLPDSDQPELVGVIVKFPAGSEEKVHARLPLSTSESFSQPEVGDEVLVFLSEDPLVYPVIFSGS